MSDNQLTNRIISDPRILAGKSVIQGTRLSVEYIGGLLSQGATPEEILTEYTGLKIEDIQACQLFLS